MTAIGVKSGAGITAMFLLLILVTGCASRSDLATDIARSASLQPTIIKTAGFDLQTHSRLVAGQDVLRIYIEGDGLAWITPTRISDDPTPGQPIALQMAAVDQTGVSIAYIGRPCQYTGGIRARNCADGKYWTTHRYAPAVVDSLAQAIRHLKHQTGATQIDLVGYSGGGTLAMLLQQENQQLPFRHIIAVAPVLDVAGWVEHHQVSPLVGSLDPAKRSPGSSNPDIHILQGGKDQVIPPALTRAALARLRNNGYTKLSLQEFGGFDHGCCWAENWPNIVARLTR